MVQTCAGICKTDEIRYWEKRVNELLKKQGQVNEDLIQVKKIRKGLFRGIVNHMNQNDEDPKSRKLWMKASG